MTEHPQGWDGKDYFTAVSELLYGSQNMPGPGGQDANTHKAFFSPAVAEQLFEAVGFIDVQVQPYNERGTDMVVTAAKPHQVDPATVAEVRGLGRDFREKLRKWDPKLPDDVVAAPSQLRTASVGFSVAQAGSKAELTGCVLYPAVTPAGLMAVDKETRDKMNQIAERANEDGVTSEIKREYLSAAGPDPAALFDKHYFNGGGKVGGYAREGYWDYPAHEVTARHVLNRRPESVLELGCARGYVLKRLQDAGVYAAGAEVSRHCYMTRVCDNVWQWDVCKTPWISELCHRIPTGRKIDLCFSIATLEHIPEEFLPAVIGMMQENCERGLHGVDFGENDDGFDQTHCTLHDRNWWLQMFARHAPGWPVEIVDKERLEDANLLPEGAAAFWEGLRKDDGLVKLNIGSFTTMFFRHWENIDAVDVSQFAAHYGYHYRHHDVRNGLPHATGTVDLIFAHHFLEHLSYAEGLTFLRECRRVLKSTGALRLAVPDAETLAEFYVASKTKPLYYEPGGHNRDPVLDRIEAGEKIGQFDEINDGCAGAPTAAGKLWELLFQGHASCYDAETLLHQLEAAGFHGWPAAFRQTNVPHEFNGREYERTDPRCRCQQILRETTEMSLGGLSLFVDAIPKLG